MATTTMRGQSIDMSKLIAKNEHKVALGNANMNARGDILGPGGKVVTFREEIAREYHTKNTRAIKQAPLRNISHEPIAMPVYASPEEAVAANRMPIKPKRKIIDSEE